MKQIANIVVDNNMTPVLDDKELKEFMNAIKDKQTKRNDKLNLGLGESFLYNWLQNTVS